MAVESVALVFLEVVDKPVADRLVVDKWVVGRLVVDKWVAGSSVVGSLVVGKLAAVDFDTHFADC